MPDRIDLAGQKRRTNAGARLFDDLSWLWPLWGDATVEYARYCDHVVGLIRRYALRPTKTLLDIGCGGGKNLLNLKRDFLVTGLDLSPAMIAQARALNPGCEIVPGDMRSFALGRTFDAILMDDAISFMDTREDFEAAFRTAFAHLAPGGVLVATPDVTKETFRQNRTTSTPAAEAVKPADLDVVFVENVYDPDPEDDRYETTMVFLVRRQGVLQVETDVVSLGVFSLDTWRDVLSGTGLEVNEGTYADGEDEYVVFACVRPAGS